MNKTFAAGLIAAAANALEATDFVSSFYTPLNAPRVTLGGPYYTTRPYYRTPAPAKKEDFHVSTDDDRYSSSDSDSISSSDEERVKEEEETCAKDGDQFACLRV
jgi:hypothetical protein